MTEKLRDYSVNGAMIIGVDNGYGNMNLECMGYQSQQKYFS